MRMWADNQLTQWPRSSSLVALWSCIWRWTPGKILEKRSKNFTFKIQCLTYVYHCSLRVFISEMAIFERTWQPYSEETSLNMICRPLRLLYELKILLSWKCKLFWFARCLIELKVKNAIHTYYFLFYFDENTSAAKGYNIFNSCQISKL